MELSLSAMAKKMIADRILGEVRNLLRDKASTVFLASVLPAAPQPDTAPALRVKADLKLAVQSVKIDCTICAGGSDDRKALVLENEEYIFSIDTGFRMQKPKDLSGSETLVLNLEKLELSGSISGIEFAKMMLGAGARVHGVELLASLSGTGTGVWQEGRETGPQDSQESARS